eukprot:TRINITY_DN10332_c0_g1_i2.p1 TRINITY_DN10332_c0_g1~~TRINITY_DN10332_c0_g1_i2.p1  ORF type:complete len:133 (+),score=24.37 TRINITY_DN10332_c0_g1_i2:178-576(+)
MGAKGSRRVVQQDAMKVTTTQNDVSYTLKVCVMGGSCVGKSALVLRFVNDRVPHSVDVNIGAVLLSKTTVLHNKRVVFDIWDTVGRHSMMALLPLYWKGTNIVIFVYNITQKISFDTLKDLFNRKMEQNEDL